MPSSASTTPHRRIFPKVRSTFGSLEARRRGELSPRAGSTRQGETRSSGCSCSAIVPSCTRAKISSSRPDQKRSHTRSTPLLRSRPELRRRLEDPARRLGNRRHSGQNMRLRVNVWSVDHADPRPPSGWWWQARGMEQASPRVGRECVATITHAAARLGCAQMLPTTRDPATRSSTTFLPTRQRCEGGTRVECSKFGYVDEHCLESAAKRRRFEIR